MSTDIDAVIRTTVEAKILEAVQSTPDYIETLVKAAINQKVDENGRVDSYSRNNTHNFLEVAVRNELQRLARVIIQEVVADSREALTTQIKASLSTDLIANAIAGGLAERVSNESWRIDVNFNLLSEN